jgi:hypothetical protein
MYSLLIVVLAFVIFRAPNMDVAMKMFESLCALSGGQLSVSMGWWAAIATFGALHLAFHRWPVGERVAELPPTLFAFAYGSAVAIVLPFAQANYQPFIYFQF